MRIKIENLSKSFGNHQVLKDVNLTIMDREIVAIMGESGSGKTTLIRCLCSLECADSGFIKLDDMDIMNPKMQKKIQQKIGFVFQNYQLFPHRTVLQNLCDAPIYQKKMSKKEAKEEAMKLLEKLQLHNKAESYPYMLSGGQKQRIAIARACMLKPEILCFDEPTSALDQASIEQLYPLLEELNKEMTIIIITHDESFASKAANRVIRLKEINHC